MNIDYSKRKRESPFAADDSDSPKNESPKNESSPTAYSRKHESPFVEAAPENDSPSPVSAPKPNLPPPQSVRPERSDKAQFSAFLGTFALIAAVPTAYWANYTYGIYQRYSANLEYWREHPEKIPNGLPPEMQIYIESTVVENAKLEASLFGAGSLLLFIIAVWLFVRAFKIGKRLKAAKLQYQPIDLRSIPPLKNPIGVKYTKYQTRLLIGLSGFFGLMTLINLKQLFTSQFTTTGDIIYKGVVLSGLILSLIGTLIFLTIRAKRQAARLFDSSGITRGDRRRFAWSEFRGAVVKTAVSRFSLKYVYRVELVFADGESVWLIPQRVKNYAEVFAFADTLPRAVFKN